MLLFSSRAELRCLRTICSTKVHEKLKAYCLSKINSDFFYYPPCVAAYNRIVFLAKKRSEIISWMDLLEDPAIEEDFRSILNSASSKVCNSKNSIDSMVDILDRYRKTRILYLLSKDVINDLKKDKINIDNTLDKVTNELNRAKFFLSEDNPIYTIGREGNSEPLLEQVLNEKKQIYYKSGFSVYDERNGGLPIEGVFVIAATTSAGKSTLLLNLLKNLYLLNKIDVCKVTLEMSDQQEMRRFLSCISEVPYSKFIQRKLTAQDNQKIRKKYREFQDFGAENECRFSHYSPNSSLTIEQILMMMKPYGYKILGIDYISLLSNSGGDERKQWQVLSEITRQCKEFSRANNCLIVLLAQLDEETEKIRYSRAIKEHADLAWVWSYNKPQQRELKVLPIKIEKARDQEIFNFELKEEFHIMTIKDMDSDNTESIVSYDDEDEELNPEMDYRNGIS